jgi:hypothetical protein
MCGDAMTQQTALEKLKLHRDRLATELHRLAAASNVDPDLIARLGAGISDCDAAIADLLKPGRKVVFVDDNPDGGVTW